jgi:dTDP-glucose 4,6-dehydratase
MEHPTILVTGGAGFIGSAVVRELLANSDARVVTLDRLTYAGSLANLGDALHHPRQRFEQVDIGDAPAVRRVLETYRPTAVLHLAAESHVDRSIDTPAPFIDTNITGTYTLLEAARHYFAGCSRAEQDCFRFVQASTDEVFGALPEAGRFTERSPYRPNSPYAASKAAADHLARAWGHTYGLPVIVTHGSNTFGPYQYPEKLIPVMVLNALHGNPLPVYGRGDQIRDWLFVEDHARALHAVLDRGQPGETYAIGGDAERRNIEIVEAICDLLDELAPGARSHRALITHVADRPGHDYRYALDASSTRQALGWRPRVCFNSGLRATVAWYLDHQAWCDTVLMGGSAAERRGRA